MYSTKSQDVQNFCMTRKSGCPESLDVQKVRISRKSVCSESQDFLRVFLHVQKVWMSRMFRCPGSQDIQKSVCSESQDFLRVCLHVQKVWIPRKFLCPKSQDIQKVCLFRKSGFPECLSVCPKSLDVFFLTCSKNLEEILSVRLTSHLSRKVRIFSEETAATAWISAQGSLCSCLPPPSGTYSFTETCVHFTATNRGDAPRLAHSQTPFRIPTCSSTSCTPTIRFARCFRAFNLPRPCLKNPFISYPCLPKPDNATLPLTSFNKLPLSSQTR